MADIKTHLRELSVATTVGLLNLKTDFDRSDLYDSRKFLKYAKKVISGDISSANNLLSESTFKGELKQIIDNGYNLGKAIYENPYFLIPQEVTITWQGNDTQKDDPIDITIDKYGFSLKEESFILENMGLYKLLNCYTGSTYKKRHIFSDYARSEYESWFSVTWNILLDFLVQNNNTWNYSDPKKGKFGCIKLSNSNVEFKYYKNENLESASTLPAKCTLSDFETNTTSKTREQVFSKYINQCLNDNELYNSVKRTCAYVASRNLANELTNNLNYNAGLPRFLRIHNFEYYYAKTTPTSIEIYKVPSVSSFGNDIIIESIEASVPDKQANILTAIKNTKTGKTLTLRNECRFSHGQFNGTPEAKMYYEYGGSLETIYEKI